MVRLLRLAPSAVVVCRLASCDSVSQMIEIHVYLVCLMGMAGLKQPSTSCCSLTRCRVFTRVYDYFLLCLCRYCVNHLALNLQNEASLSSNPTRALINAFLATDRGFLEQARGHHPPIDDGTTAVATLVVGDMLWAANGATWCFHCCICIILCMLLLICCGCSR